MLLILIVSSSFREIELIETTKKQLSLAMNMVEEELSKAKKLNENYQVSYFILINFEKGFAN
jgi:hypothetical protein